MKRVTGSLTLKEGFPDVSIHTRVKRVTCGSARYLRGGVVSIHTRVKRVTINIFVSLPKQ